MVRIGATGFLSDIRDQSSYREFPENDFQEIKSAIENVPTELFIDRTKGSELKKFDLRISEGLKEYEYEHNAESGRNPVCKLWKNEGFNHSVDLYHPEKRIAIEIEKSEQKRVSDDILKFIKGGKTQLENRKKIEFGSIIVPTNYRGSGNVFRSSMRNLEFMRSILFVEDVAVIGYKDPRWD